MKSASSPQGCRRLPPLRMPSRNASGSWTSTSFAIRRHLAEFASEFQTADDARIFQKMILGSAADVAEYFFESATRFRPTSVPVRPDRDIPRSAGCGNCLRQALPLDGHGHRPSRSMGIRQGCDGSGHQALQAGRPANGVTIRTSADVANLHRQWTGQRRSHD